MLEHKEEDMKNMKDKVLEIVDIAKSCPENLQTLCFEILLKHFLASLEQAPDKSKKEAPTGTTPKPSEKAEPSSEVKSDEEASKGVQEDIRESDLHVKMKRFMKKAGVTITELNNLYYKEGDLFLPLFDDLKTTQMAESQIRVTLLQCLVNALTTGEFEAKIEAVRAECTQRKCYNSSNFTANYRNNGELFDSDKIDRKTANLKLSDTGRKKLADLIKELK